MGIFDFLKVNVVDDKPRPYDAQLKVNGKSYRVENLGIESVTFGKAPEFKKGQKVKFDLALKDPKETLAFQGSGTVIESGSQTKIGYALSGQHKGSVARFLARYMMR